MLIYDQPDFSGLVDEVVLRRLDEWTFDASLHPFFETQTTHFSVILKGRIHYRSFCDTPIYNRRELPQEATLVTFSVETNLSILIKYDGKVVLESPQKQTKPQLYSFDISVANPALLHEFEVKMSDMEPLG